MELESFSSQQFADVRAKLPHPTVTMIFNEKAGSNRRHPLRTLHFRRMVKDVHTLLGPDMFGFDVRFRPTASEDHARKEIDEAIALNQGGIFVIGGDASIDLVAGALREADNETILIPAGGGTQNIFRNECTSGKNPLKAAIDLFVNGRSVNADVGVIQVADDNLMNQDFPFLTNAGIGLDAVVSGIWHDEGKNHRAELFKIFLRERHNFKPHTLQVVDPIEGHDLFLQDVVGMPIVNAGPYGGFFPITDSDMTDGVMEAVVMRSPHLETGNFVHWIGNAVRPGRTIEDAQYLALQHATIRDVDGRELIFQHGGETRKTGASEITVFSERQAISVLSAKH